MSQKRDYYEVLGLSKDATPQEIKNSFRKLAKKYHPDVSKEPDAKEKFQEIGEAYGILSDPKKREAYDRGGFSGVSHFSYEDVFGGIDLSEIFGQSGFGFDFGGFGGNSIFDSLFGRSHTQRAGGEDIKIEAAITLSEVKNGAQKQVKLHHYKACDACHGSGAAQGTEPKTCDLCQGRGQITHTEQKGNTTYSQTTICTQCHGTGKIIETPCPVCNGSGKVSDIERIPVDIPVGAEEGMPIRISGKGKPPHTENGKAGDLIVIVRTLNQPNFTRDGADLWHLITIEMIDAVLGAKIEIETIQEHVAVTIPQGTQPDATLHIKEKGLPKLHGNGRGDLYLQVKIHIPEILSDKEKELFSQLKSLKHEDAKRIAQEPIN